MINVKGTLIPEKGINQSGFSLDDPGIGINELGKVNNIFIISNPEIAII